MPNQRSILSFFGSSASTDLSKPQSQSQQPQLQPKPLQSQSQSQSKLPPPPPPPSFNRFVPPPSARNGNGYAPPPGMSATANANANANAARHGGSPDPSLDLAPITPAYGRSIFQAAGATELDGGSVISFPSCASNKIVFPCDIHMPDLVSINGILLPVRYSDSFYKGVTDPTRMVSLFNRIILGDDGKTVVGGIVCRLEPNPFGDSTPGSGLAVYIQSLAMLSPYRGRGLMAAALDSIIATVQALNQKAAVAGGPLAATGPISSLFAHVWTEHDDALNWYTSRQFVRQGDAPLEDYYFALRPATAWIVRRDVSVEVDPSVTQLVLEATQQAKKEQQQQQQALKAAAANSLPPPPPRSSSSSLANSRSQSYQNSRPEMAWNDLPADMVTTPGLSANASTAASSRNASRNVSRKVSQVNLTDCASSSSNKENDDSPPPPGASSLLAPPGANGAQASSRSSSSTGKKKRERAYPAAMFQ